ncbi:MAG TPA: phosphoribosylanthranilate isomerase [Calditrichia bacterium]|nr:phosphoribosylanthranilate isomerase [Calditrichota bacterium]HQU70670.1 phosphoribosylanthranilate isomerase [Calditrichia bacterium]HQV31257.1 phosphoribosylanthranilate isomerase [Calditrichia bacterium]
MQTNRLRVKICCISSVEEARTAISLGADALGLVSSMPSGPGVIPEETIAGIAASTPPGVNTFLLTSLQDPDAIIEQHRRCGTDTIQLVDALPDGAHQEIRRALPGIRLVQVIHVLDRESIAEAQRVAPHVHALLLDSGNPKLAVKTLGGTGRTHNWEISRELVAAVKRPVFLAGGLTAENIGEAVAGVRPFGVDLCSGVRTGGKLDPEKLKRFFEEAGKIRIV